MVEEPTNDASAAVDGAASAIRALEADASVLISRLQFMKQAGISFEGARDLYSVLGYDREITSLQYRERYERGGIAGTIVDVMVDAAWRGGMWLEEDEDPEKNTPFEAAWIELEERLNLTTYLIRADRLSRLSDYAVMLIGTSLDGDLRAELPKGKPENMIYLQPYSGGGGPSPRQQRHLQTNAIDARARVASYDRDPKSPRFGQPATYDLLLDDGQWYTGAHFSRVIHVAENCLDDDVFGRSVLKRVWNLLDDLDKVTGGGSEAFWLRANQGTHLNIDKDMQLQPNEFADVVAKLREQSELYKHQLTRWLQTRGVDVKTLGSDVANFAAPADAVLKQIAGTSRIPTRILTGSEMGELASSQDRENFKDQVNGRQEQHIGPNIVRRLADRLIEYGYLPTPAKGPRKYKVKFAHIQTLTEQERADGAAKWAAVNSAAGMTVFTESEIRDHWYGLAPTDRPAEEAATEKWKADLAMKMASANATQGAVIFTDDEIRATCYGWAPLTPEQKAAAAPVPAGMPAPTDKNAVPDDSKKVLPFKAASDAEAAEDAELLRVLTAAIEAGNDDVVMRIVGLGDHFERALQAGPHQYGTTQVQLPADLAARLVAFGEAIPDEDIYEPGGGRETDLHVTVKYGLIDPDPDLLSQVVVKRGAFTPVLSDIGRITLTLGTIGFFQHPDYDVVIVNVKSQDLADLNRAIAAGLECAPSQHAGYVPHATIAYVKPGVGARYAGRVDFDGIVVSADTITMINAEGERTEVKLA